MTKPRPGAVYPWNRYWNTEKIVAEIREMARVGEPLNPQAVRSSLSYRAVYGAAYYHVGGWAKALKLAGIDPRRVYVRQMQSVREAVGGDGKDEPQRCD